MQVTVRRVYDPPGSHEGLRVLVDRLWPRGVSKEALKYDIWEKSIAPTPELRKWFGHAPQRWDSFREKYRKELKTAEVQERLKAILEQADKRNITLLYGARDAEHNHALILADELERLYSG